MKLNSLFSLFGSNTTTPDLQNYSIETPEKTQSRIRICSEPLDDSLNTIELLDESIDSSDTNEMFVEFEELNSFIEDLLSNQNQTNKTSQEVDLAKQNNLVKESFYIDESEPNSLLELDSCF
jgi:hypothetical protein